jgi:hypothetical protein
MRSEYCTGLETQMKYHTAKAFQTFTNRQSLHHAVNVPHLSCTIPKFHALPETGVQEVEQSATHIVLKSSSWGPMGTTGNDPQACPKTDALVALKMVQEPRVLHFSSRLPYNTMNLRI